MTTYFGGNGRRLSFAKLNTALVAGDLCLLVVSYYTGVFLRWASFENFFPSLLHHAIEATTFTVVILAMMFAVGLYRRDLEGKISVLSVRLVVALVLSFFVFTMIFYVFPPVLIWRSALAIAIPLAFVLILLWRFGWIRLIDHESIKRPILVVGCGEQAAYVDTLSSSKNNYPFRCLGFVKLHGETPAVAPERIISNNRPLHEIVEDLGVREVVIATEDWRNRLSVDEMMQCSLTGTQVSDYLSFREKETGSVDLDAIRPSWFIFSGGFPGGPLQQGLKRVFDIIVAAAALVFFLPLICATAIAIRLESPGPIFHFQERIGLNGRRFVTYKFRSMREDAEVGGQPQWAQEDDPRVTAVGRLIRRTRIDELPQIINVLRGEMSFVGPRPERPYFVEQLAAALPYYHARHRVKPGITGWAQLNYIYGASIEGAKQKLQYDLYYVKHYSIFLDFLIILQTVRVILWPQGVR